MKKHTKTLITQIKDKDIDNKYTNKNTKLKKLHLKESRRLNEVCNEINT